MLTRTSSIWDTYDKLYEEQQDQEISINSSGWEPELQSYINLPNIPRSDNIFSFWKNQRHENQELSAIALQRLANLATTLPSERLFSQAGLINAPHRSKLSGTHLNMLVFLSSFSVEAWN